MPTVTPILRLHVPDFDQDPWDEDVNSNWYALDAAVGMFSTVPNSTGVWKNSVSYLVGQSAVDAVDGSTWMATTAHTSDPSPATFFDDRTAHPGRWTQVSNTAQFYAAQAAQSAVDAAQSAADAAGVAGTTDAVLRTGDTMTGPLILSGPPTISNGAATKNYVDTHGGTSSTDWINVKDHGAIGDGTADDTAAINATITAAPVGSTIFFPGGVYKISSTIAVNKMLTLLGSGRLSSTISINQAAASIFTITDIVNITALGFTCSVTATSGFFITYNGSATTRSRLQSFWMTNFFSGINIINTSDLMIIDGQMFNWASGGTGILYTGGEAMVIDNLIMQQGIRPGNGNGIVVKNGGMQLINSEIMACGMCLVLSPGSGQAVVSMWVVNTAFDNGVQGITIAPSGSGAVARCWFIGCWMSSMTVCGVSISSPTAGAVDGIDFNGCHLFDNGQHGFYMPDANARNLNIVNCSIAGNHAYGILFISGGAEFQIANCTIGPYGIFPKNTAGGLCLNGSSVEYRVVNNDLANGGTGAFTGSGVHSGPSPGVSEIIQGNIGHNSSTRGTGTIGAGGLGVAVAHSLNGTPRLQDIQVSCLTGMGNPPGAIPFIISPTPTTFTIEIGIPLAFTTAFAWSAKLPCNP